jgi:hypothetical protein
MNKPSILEELKASLPEIYKFAKSLPASESDFYMDFLMVQYLKENNTTNAEGGSK